jgi:fructosamine-3-kinase
VSRSATAGLIGRLTGLAVRDARVAGAQHGYQHLMITLADGRRAFAKAVLPETADRGTARNGAPERDPGADPDRGAVTSDGIAAAFAAEANGLRWLADAGAVAVPDVLAVGPRALVISMIPPGRATPEAAFSFGAELARLHAAGAAAFGAPWPGFIAGLPLDNTPLDNTPLDNKPLDNTPLDNTPLDNNPRADAARDWPRWYAHRRLLPFLSRAVDTGALQPADARLVEAAADRIGSVAGPAEPPSRIHGDCWAGNVLWSGGRGWLIDPAAHGGHRETDLAMLALFGAPSLDRILAGYEDTVPLAAGWRSRIPLHQLHPLLVHACLFGASYREEVRSAARAVLAL